jgi:outer membrane protein assembly factor BamB
MSRSPLARLLGLAPAALLISGLVAVWAGPLAGPVAADGLASIVLSPNPVTIVASTTQTYTTEGFDSIGTDLGDVTSSTVFAIDGAGSCSAAACGSTVAGDYTITASNGAATATATLHVTPMPLGLHISGAAGALALGLMPGASLAAPAQPHPAIVSGDWTQFHNDVTHQGYNTAETVLSPSNVGALGVAWTATTGGSIFNSSPAVADGVVYVGSEDGKLYAYAVGCASGGGSCTPLWTATTGSGIVSSPAVADGVVYVGSDDHKLYAYAIGCASGGGSCTPLWTATTAYKIYSSPTVADGVVYIGSEDRMLYAYTVGCNSGGGSCTPLWTAATGTGIWSSPAVANGVVYIGSTDGKLYANAVGCASGGGSCTPLWTATTGGYIHSSSPAVANGVVYVGSYDGKLYAYAVGCASGGGSCTPLWTATTGGVIYSSPAVANGVVYVGSEDGKLHAYAVGCASGGGSCTPLWTATTGSGITSSPAVANGVVYVGSEDGKLYAYAVGCASGGGSCTPLWTATTGSGITSSPAVASGLVYVGSYDGKLYAFGLNPLDHLVLNPASATITAGGSQAYTAEGFDAYGHSLGDVTSATTFIVIGGSCTGASCTSTVPGDHTVTGTDGSATGTATLHVNAGTATQLAVLGLASPRTAGVAGNVTVTALDQYNNTATGYAGTVHFTSSDGAAVLPANATLTNGVGIFSVTLKTAGTQSVTVTDTDNSSITGSQTGIVVYAGATYHPLTPTRILDSRDGTGGLSGKFSTNVARTFQVAGNGVVPTGATAVTGNLTVTEQSAYGYLYIGPIAMNNPTSSNLNFPAGDNRANAVSVALGTGGTGGALGTLSITYVSPWAGQTTHVVFDVTGYYTPDMTGATYHPLSPTRILDSRNGTGGLSGKFSTNVARTFQVAGAGVVPSGATAVTGNLTVTEQSAYGYLYIGPIAMNNPSSSNLNFPAGDNRANAVSVALGTGGALGTLSITYVSPWAGQTTHVVFDVTGYYTPDMTGATYHPLSPTRILDSRNGTGGLSGKFSTNVARTFQVAGAGVVPSGATAVTGNLTVTEQSAYGYLYIGPIAMNNPSSSNLNFPAGDNRANAVSVALGTGGALGTLSITYVSPWAGQTTHVVFDVTGYFTP